MPKTKKSKGGTPQSSTIVEDIPRSSRSVPSIQHILREVKLPSTYRANESDYTRKQPASKTVNASPRRSIALNRRTTDIVIPRELPSFTSRIGSLLSTKRPKLIIPDHPLTRQMMLTNPVPELHTTRPAKGAGKSKKKHTKTKK